MYPYLLKHMHVYGQLIFFNIGHPKKIELEMF